VEKSESKDPIRLAGLLSWASEEHPEVIHIAQELFHREQLRSKELGDAVALCWSRGSLPVSVVTSPGTWIPPGILPIWLTSEEEAEGAVVSSADHLLGLRVVLALHGSTLKGGPEELDRERKAVAYATLLASAIPADGALAHLERTARLALQGPVRQPADHSQPSYVILDPHVSLLREPEPVPFMSHSHNWNARVSEFKGVVDLRTKFSGVNESSRRLISVVHGGTYARYLASVERLIGLQTIYLFASDRETAIVFFRLLEPANLEWALNLLRNEQGKESDGHLFKQVERDAQLGRP